MTRVVVTSLPGLATQARARGHVVTVDEPLEAGGADSAPTPYEMLLAALGSCTAITLRMYATRKQWPLEGVEVILEHDRVHADDCRDCDTRDGRIDRVRKQVNLHGPLDEAQRRRLREIAERCPVNLTLQREILVEQRPSERLG